LKNGGAAVHGRYNILTEDVTRMYKEKELTRDQVKQIMEYMKRTLFSHIQLFLNSLANKQPRKTKSISLCFEKP